MALATLAGRHPQLRYRLIGDGPDRARLERLAGSLGVADRVTFEGRMPHEQALAELARCHLHVMPSLHDAFGVAHIEAMAAGLVAIAGAGTGAADIAEAGEGIVLVPSGDQQRDRASDRRADLRPRAPARARPGRPPDGRAALQLAGLRPEHRGAVRTARHRRGSRSCENRRVNLRIADSGETVAAQFESRIDSLEQQQLSSLATRSYPAQRGRAEPACRLRTPFQRDRDRIVHSKSFRRLKHKTQVFIDPDRRPLPHPHDPHARDLRHLAHGRARTAPQRGPDRGDRARPRPRAPALRPHRRAGARPRAAREHRQALPPQRPLAAGGRRART